MRLPSVLTDLSPSHKLCVCMYDSVCMTERMNTIYTWATTLVLINWSHAIRHNNVCAKAYLYIYIKISYDVQYNSITRSERGNTNNYWRSFSLCPTVVAWTKRWNFVLSLLPASSSQCCVFVCFRQSIQSCTGNCFWQRWEWLHSGKTTKNTRRPQNTWINKCRRRCTRTAHGYIDQTMRLLPEVAWFQFCCCVCVSAIRS